MRNVKGFTLIEGITILTIVGIIGSMGFRVYKDSNAPEPAPTQCISGYTFTNTVPPKQIISQDGGGVPCREGDYQSDSYNTWAN